MDPNRRNEFYAREKFISCFASSKSFFSLSERITFCEKSNDKAWV